MPKIRLAILISGRGSNMEALIKACAQADFPATIAVVIANRPDAGGLAKAQSAGLKTALVDHKKFPTRQDFEAALQDALQTHGPIDLICLAGFMRVLTPWFVDQWDGRMINIHPSLLPDYKGLDTHARALADGRAESGCSVHYVVPEMDDGPLILQRRVPILPGDTPDRLAARVLAAEHIAYPEAVTLVAEKLKKRLMT
ncbi:MAG TPA: phosphoribosylglycinamide formyltransferase [Micavibrio sp.]